MPIKKYLILFCYLDYISPSFIDDNIINVLVKWKTFLDNVGFTTVYFTVTIFLCEQNNKVTVLSKILKIIIINYIK